MQKLLKFPDLEIRSTRATALALADKRGQVNVALAWPRVWAGVATGAADWWGLGAGVARK